MLSAWALVASFARAQAPSAAQIKGRVAPPFSVSAQGASLLAPAETLQIKPGANDVVGLSNDIGLPGGRMIRAASTATPTSAQNPAEGLLWYNGDFNGVDGLSNEEDTILGAGQYSHIYDDFDVESPGLDVGAVFSNNLTDTNIIGATWEIRQGIFPGSGGTLIASGMTVTPTVTATGRSGFGYTEYTVQVNGIFVYLPPGNGYFLNVTPIGDLTGRSYVSTTSGAHAVGQPPGNNQNAFLDSPFFHADFQSTADFGQPYDYSMGLTVAGEDKLVLQSAFSRKRHGAAGNFDLPLPITGAEGIESRAGGDSIDLTFNHNLVGVGSAVSSCGSASVWLDPHDAESLIVTVQDRSCDATDITLTVNDILDDRGEWTTATLTYGKLIGDVDGSGVVDSLDGQAIRAVAPSPVDSSNFRDDLNHDGSVNARDYMIAKSHRGERLP